jgi:TonB family protein
MKLARILSFVFVLILATSAIAQQSDRDRGIDLYREGKFSEAIATLEAALAANENDRAAWTYLGGSYINAGHEEKAAAAFGRTFGLKSSSPPPTYERTVKVTYKPHPSYPRQARMNGSTGKVRLAVEFRSDGKIGFTFPVNSSVNNDLLEPSIDAARAIGFEPAIKNGQPVTVINIVEYEYKIY